ncbi:hypothetical protein AAMO2058_000390200 [Amorphochlora amoebiformis]
MSALLIVLAGLPLCFGVQRESFLSHTNRTEALNHGHSVERSSSGVEYVSELGGESRGYLGLHAKSGSAMEIVRSRSDIPVMHNQLDKIPPVATSKTTLTNAVTEPINMASLSPARNGPNSISISPIPEIKQETGPDEAIVRMTHKKDDFVTYK